MDEIVNKNHIEVIEIGVIPCYYYDNNGARYNKDSFLSVKFINGKPILLVDLSDKIRVIEIGNFKHNFDEYNGKVGIDRYYFNIPSTVMSILSISSDN